MFVPEDTQKMYEKLAQQCQRRKETQQRDVFLVLAADSALTLGRSEQAERLHRQLVELSPSTMLRAFASFADALHSGDVREYVFDLRKQYPPERAVRLLEPNANGTLLPPDLFDDPPESDVILPLLESSSPFGDSVHTAPVDVPQRRSTAPAIHIPPPARSAAVDVPAAPATAPVNSPPPSPPAKPRRRSPYEDPEYGPKVPAKSKRAEDFLGMWIINLLVGLIGLLAASIVAFVFVRPFLPR